MSTENKPRWLRLGMYLLTISVSIIFVYHRFTTHARVVPLSNTEMVSLCTQFRTEIDWAEKLTLAKRIVELENVFLATNHRFRHDIAAFVALMGPPDIYGDGFCDYFISTNECPRLVLSLRSIHYLPTVDVISIADIIP